MSDKTEIEKEIARRSAECERINGEMQKLEARIAKGTDAAVISPLADARLLLKTQKIGHRSVIADLEQIGETA